VFNIENRFNKQEQRLNQADWETTLLRNLKIPPCRAGDFSPALRTPGGEHGSVSFDSGPLGDADFTKAGTPDDR
jgi:hypothetical protein